MSEVILNDLIIPSFRQVVQDIIECNYDEIVLKGGRSSTKSQAGGGFGIVLGVMSSHESAICIVRNAVGIENRLVNTFKFAIEQLHVEKYWKLRRSPFEYVLLDSSGRESSVSIKFMGADVPDNLKSVKSRNGASFRYLFIEEATNFKSMKDIKNLEQTFLRGSGKHTLILAYNPPMSSGHWLNKRYNYPIGKCLGYDTDVYKETYTYNLNGKQLTKKLLVHHSSYLDVVEAGHEDWLGSILVNALQSKDNNERYYRWAYLGEVIGTDANVFWNIHKWNYDEQKISGLVLRGLDVSNGGSDPWAYTECFYDKSKNDLYIVGEQKISGKASLDEVGRLIKDKAGRKDIFIDSAVPTFARTLNMKGLSCIPARKGKDSIVIGIMWLQSLNHIYIDPTKCPNAFKELTEYEYVIDKNDECTNELPDKNNHFIDSIRYACSTIIRHGNV